MKRVPLRLLFGVLVLCGLAALLQSTSHLSILSDPARLWNRVIWPLIRLSFFISIGLFAALIIEGAGWTRRLTILARPFMRWGHLSDQMGSAFTASFLSGTSSLAMLSGFHREGVMGRRDLTLAVLLATFPSYFLHLPTTFFLILPLVGKAGVVYLLVTLGAALLRFISLLVYTRFTMPLPNADLSSPVHDHRDWKELLTTAARRLSSRFTRIVLIVAPIYLAMLVLSDVGFFEWLRKSLAVGVGRALFPVEGISVVILSLMAELTSGYAAAGAMLHSGTLTLTQTVVALIAGQIIGTPIRALRHQLPYYMGLFRPGLGLFLMAASQCFRVISLGIAAGVFLLFT